MAIWADFLHDVLPCGESQRTQILKGRPEKYISLVCPAPRKERSRYSHLVEGDEVNESRGRVGLPSDLKQMVNRWDKVGATDFYRYLFEGLLGDYYKGPKIRGPLP